MGLFTSKTSCDDVRCRYLARLQKGVHRRSTPALNWYCNNKKAAGRRLARNWGASHWLVDERGVKCHAWLELPKHADREGSEGGQGDEGVHVGRTAPERFETIDKEVPCGAQ